MILEEFETVLSNKPSIGTAFRALNGEAIEDWRSLLLRRVFHDCSVLSEHFPKTRRLITSVPVAAEALFSILEPAARLRAHVDSYPMTLTYHLPLVAHDATVIVGSERRKVEVGKSLMFDHSFLHSAWNESDKPRLHLILNVWHPALTPLEEALLEKFVPWLDDYLESVGVEV